MFESAQSLSWDLPNGCRPAKCPSQSGTHGGQENPSALPIRPRISSRVRNRPAGEDKRSSADQFVGKHNLHRTVKPLNTRDVLFPRLRTVRGVDTPYGDPELHSGANSDRSPDSAARGRG